MFFFSLYLFETDKSSVGKERKERKSLVDTPLRSKSTLFDSFPPCHLGEGRLILRYIFFAISMFRYDLYDLYDLRLPTYYLFFSIPPPLTRDIFLSFVLFIHIQF